MALVCWRIGDLDSPIGRHRTSYPAAPRLRILRPAWRYRSWQRPPKGQPLYKLNVSMCSPRRNRAEGTAPIKLIDTSIGEAVDRNIFRPRYLGKCQIQDGIIRNGGEPQKDPETERRKSAQARTPPRRFAELRPCPHVRVCGPCSKALRSQPKTVRRDIADLSAQGFCQEIPRRGPPLRARGGAKGWTIRAARSRR